MLNPGNDLNVRAGSCFVKISKALLTGSKETEN